MSSSMDQILQDAVDSGAVPNVAAIATDRNGVIYEGAAGPRVAGGSDPVTVDTHFRVMSMTKMPVTSVLRGNSGPCDLALRKTPDRWLEISGPSYRAPARASPRICSMITLIGNIAEFLRLA